MNKKILGLIGFLGFASFSVQAFSWEKLRWEIQIANNTANPIKVEGTFTDGWVHCWWTDQGTNDFLQAQSIEPGQTRQFNTNEMIGYGYAAYDPCTNDSLYSWMNFYLDGKVLTLGSDHGRFTPTGSGRTPEAPIYMLNGGGEWWIDLDHKILSPDGKPFYVNSGTIFNFDSNPYISANVTYNGPDDISYTMDLIRNQ